MQDVTIATAILAAIDPVAFPRGDEPDPNDAAGHRGRLCPGKAQRAGFLGQREEF